MDKINAVITGIGGYVPDDILSNADICQMVDTTDEWIMTRVGIKERRILKGEGKGTSFMGIRAVNELLKKTNVDPKEIEVLCIATTTADYHFPTTASIIAHNTGCVNAMTFDLQGACAGFLYALENGANYIRSGRYKKVIVVAGDKMTAITNYTDRTTCPLFGDGCGAVLLEPTTEEFGVMDTLLRTDGNGLSHLIMKGGGTRKFKQGYRSHKLKPYREAAKAEKAAFKANVNFQYHKVLQENPQLTSNPFSRFMQKQKIKRQYAKTVKKGGAATAKATAGASQTAAKKAAAFVGRHPAGVIIAIAALLLFIMVSVGLSSCGAMFSGSMNSVLGTSYTSEDSDLVATEQSYAAMENELQSEIDNIETTHSGYDEYRYDLDTIGHNPHELASYLTALLQSYTPQSAQAELKRLFGLQYTLTLTEEIEIRTTTDEEGNEEEYEYRILNVKLTNKPIASLAEELLNPQQFEMFKVYLQTQGNKPLIFGGGSPDGSPSEDLSGVEFVNGTRPGNPEFMELAKQQVGNVGGYPYWSWYGFNSRVEWCACFVSWCYNQAGKSEPRFAGCEWQGVPWFQSRGQWGARGYENIAPGDAIFFDWDLDGVADHVGLVLGRDGSRVYTVEGNSGDACKIKSYDLNYQCIKGYGLMNW